LGWGRRIKKSTQLNRKRSKKALKMNMRLSVILRVVAGSMRRLDSATALRFAQNDGEGCSEFT
jgi:hypothetical protein